MSKQKRLYLTITEYPKQPLHGDYFIFYGLAVDAHRNIYELIFEADENNKRKIGALASVKNCITNTAVEPDIVVLKGLRKHDRKKENKF